MKRMMLVALGLFALAQAWPSAARAQTSVPVSCGQGYSVLAGDWLSKIADKEYGNPLLYFPIFSATNAKAAADKTYNFIDNANLIEVGWKLCLPVVPKPSAGLGLNDLRNASYNSEFGENGVAKLTNGKFSLPAAPGSASMNSVTFVNDVNYGTVNGQPLAAVVLAESGGGSGTFYNLALVQAPDARPVNVANAALGDRVVVNSVEIGNDSIYVVMERPGANDPLCCPTERVVATYRLNGNKLESTGVEVIGKALGG